MKTLLALLLATATLLADVSPQPTPALLEADEVLDIVLQKMHFVQLPTIKDGPEDARYVAPTQELIDDLMAFFKARREMIPWIEDAFDCDDKATEFKYLASVWSVRQWRGKRPGVLVGKAYVHLDGDYSQLFPGTEGEWVEGYHVLNFIIRSDGEVFFIEPQTGRIAEVSSFIYEGSIELIRLEY